MRNIVLAAAAAAVAVPTTMVVPTDSAQAQRRYYTRDGYYNGPVWRDSRGRYRCRRGNGTTGLIIGAAGGALVGRAIDGGRNRTTGTIVGAVAKLGADMIVMATHGRGGLQHLFIGSVAEKVVRAAPCPVLTVRVEKARRAGGKKSRRARA